MKPNIIYLHGFTSSPMTAKGQHFRERLATHYDIPLQLPDLNRPSFERLTLTAMLHTVADVVRACPPGPVYLIGSSMGGLTALHFINRYQGSVARRVELLFLLAPAFDFMEIRERALGLAALGQWRDTGWLVVDHYASGEKRRVHYGLVEDMTAYESYGVHVEIPVMIYHGQQDETVPVTQSQRFAADRGNVQLKVVDSDHSLMNQLDPIWQDMVSFFAL
jgi:uncharacterized protein